MDCPNCGVYNPDSRDVCWRCDKELPKPAPPKKRSDPLSMRRMWLIVAIALALWIVLSWLLPVLLNSRP